MTECFDIDLFTRAARRAGLIASLQKRALKSILPSTLPVVLELHGNRVCILMKMEGDHARIIHPGDDETELTVKVSELESSYSKFCFLIKQLVEEPIRENHWFWNVINMSKGIYAEVLFASFLINCFALATPLFFIMNVYDRVIPNYAIETLWVLVSGVILVLLFDLVMKSLRVFHRCGRETSRSNTLGQHVWTNIGDKAQRKTQ